MTDQLRAGLSIRKASKGNVMGDALACVIACEPNGTDVSMRAIRASMNRAPVRKSSKGNIIRGVVASFVEESPAEPVPLYLSQESTCSVQSAPPDVPRRGSRGNVIGHVVAPLLENATGNIPTKRSSQGYLLGSTIASLMGDAGASEHERAGGASCLERLDNQEPVSSQNLASRSAVAPALEPTYSMPDARVEVHVEPKL